MAADLRLASRVTGAPGVGVEPQSAGAQAEADVARELSAPREEAPVAGFRRVVGAGGGGKCGICKALVASNLGVHLASLGKKVVLVDADLGGANLHTWLGMSPPKKTLSDFVDRKVTSLHDVVTPTPVE